MLISLYGSSSYKEGTSLSTSVVKNIGNQVTDSIASFTNPKIDTLSSKGYLAFS